MSEEFEPTIEEAKAIVCAMEVLLGYHKSIDWRCRQVMTFGSNYVDELVGQIKGELYLDTGLFHTPPRHRESSPRVFTIFFYAKPCPGGGFSMSWRLGDWNRQVCGDEVKDPSEIMLSFRNSLLAAIKRPLDLIEGFKLRG